MSVILVQMPSLSPTMEKGNIAEWKVKEGDVIESGQVLAAIATDKSTVDYESLDEGTLRKIVQPAGADAVVGHVIAVITEEPDEAYEEELAAALAEQGGAEEEEPETTETTEETSEVKAAPAPKAVAGGPVTATIVPAVNPPADIPQPKGLIPDRPNWKVSPAARKLAERRNINLAKVEPKTTKNRIVMADLEELPNNYGQTIAERNSGLIGYVNRAPQPSHDVKMSQMRSAITDRMVQASAGVPVFYLTVAVEMDDLMAVRKQVNTMENFKVSINDFIVKAVAMALRDYPDVNSAYQGDFIRQFSDVDIAIAVSIPDGLITPIIRSADTKGLLSINQDVKSLVAKAKTNELTLPEYQGGSFTISNLGMFGAVEEFTAILNPPQAGILAVGGTTPTLKMVDGQVKEVNVCRLTLTADHRVIDGALAAQFMNAIKNYLETPVKLVI